MNRSSIAALVVCLTAGMAGLAQAQSSPTTTPSPSMGGTAPSSNNQMSNPSYNSRSSLPSYDSQANSQRPMQGGQAEPAQEQIEQAQQQLKAQGLYRGAIDGVIGPETKAAISQFQRRNGLPRTATLDQQTMQRLMGNTTSGAGSTMGPSSGMGSTMGSQPSTSAPGANPNSTAPQAPTKRY